MLMHYLPGRIRIAVPGLKRNPALAERLRGLKDRLTGIENIYASPLTGRCLVNFDEQIVSRQRVISALNRSVGSEPAAGSVAVKQPVKNQPAEPEDRPVSAQLRHVLMGGGILTLFWQLPPVGPRIPTGLPLPLSLAALVSTGYPYMKSGMENWRKHKQLNHDFLLSVMSLASALVGEGYLGLSALWLTSLVDTLQKIFLKKFCRTSRRMLIRQGDRVSLVEGEKVKLILPSELKPGDTILYRQGDYISVDGEVVQGEAKVLPVHTSPATLPFAKKIGQSIWAGAKVVEGKMQVKVSKAGDDTSLATMVDTLEEALALRGESDKFALAYARQAFPISLFFTTLVYAYTGNIRRSLAMLLASSPGPSGLAAPSSLAAGLGQGARQGITFSSAQALAQLGDIDVVMFNSSLINQPRSKAWHKVVHKLRTSGLQVELLDVNQVQAEAGGPNQGNYLKELKDKGLKVAWVCNTGDKSCVREMADLNIVLARRGEVRCLKNVDVVIYSADPKEVYRAINLSRRTGYNLKGNVDIVSWLNTLGNALGAVGLTGHVSGALFSLGTNFAVLANASRIYRIKGGCRKTTF